MHETQIVQRVQQLQSVTGYRPLIDGNMMGAGFGEGTGMVSRCV